MSPRFPAISSALLLLLPLGAGAQPHEHASAYVDYQDREIKALSAEEVEALLGGEGMEMALPAELHGYPGPRHVLDLAAELELTPSQRTEVEAVFQTMLTRARSLGREIVDLERELDAAFAAGTISQEKLEHLVEEVGARSSDLRAVHLRAHLELHPVLTEDQRVRYSELRGYPADEGCS